MTLLILMKAATTPLSTTPSARHTNALTYTRTMTNQVIGHSDGPITAFNCTAEKQHQNGTGASFPSPRTTGGRAETPSTDSINCIGIVCQYRIKPHTHTCADARA